MLEISWDEKSLDSFYKKMGNLIKNLATHTENGIENASEETRKYALSQKRGNKSDDLIVKEVSKNSKEINARVYTNFLHAPFLEYGTGIKAEMPHIGKTKTFLESGYTYWYLPLEKVKTPLNNPTININGTLFYIMFSTQPYPFMRPTAFYMKPKNIETIKANIQKGILSDIK